MALCHRSFGNIESVTKSPRVENTLQTGLNVDGMRRDERMMLDRIGNATPKKCSATTEKNP